MAGAPLEGIWRSTDLGGPVPVGRYTESWATGGAPMQAGTTLNAASWDGVTLGGAWSYSCATELTAAVLLDDSVDAQGFGTRTWRKTFSGGQVWLSGTGPWSTGDAQYTGPIVSYVEFETVTYVAFLPIAATTNIQASAMIIGYDTLCLGFTVGNGAKVGDSLSGATLPANYPALLTPSCSPSGVNGAWWNLAQLTLYITNCSVGTQADSWGGIKSLYR
ncbi:MAG: hypothetical protein ACYDIE_06110 [Candidatus Krumholzibacteriia bacterium]